MGNCVRREVGFEVEDETEAPPAPEIIDKIIVMKNSAKLKHEIVDEDNLNTVEIREEPPKKIRNKPKLPKREIPKEVIEEPIKPPTPKKVYFEEKQESPKIIKNPSIVKEPSFDEEEIKDEPKEIPIEEKPRKSRRIFLGDFASDDRRDQITIRDSVNVKEDNLNLYI